MILSIVMLGLVVISFNELDCFIISGLPDDNPQWGDAVAMLLGFLFMTIIGLAGLVTLGGLIVSLTLKVFTWVHG